jgi:hypothetical protein
VKYLVVGCLISNWILTGSISFAQNNRFFLELSGGLGAMYWHQDHHNYLEFYKASSNRSGIIEFDDKLSASGLVYTVQSKFFIRMNKISLGPSYGLSGITIDQVNRPAGAIGSYQPQKKWIHTFGISGEYSWKELDKVVLLPTLNAGLHFFDKKDVFEYSNNYYFQAGLKINFKGA